MRKTSQDTGDSYSITSGVENELKKPLMSLLKNKKGSLKRKPPNSSKESDDTVVEPLLSKDKEKPGTSQSAKFFPKPKAEACFEKMNEKSKLINDNTIQNTTSSPIITAVNVLKENTVSKPVSTAAPPIHNYMNTNVFNSHDSKKVDLTAKSQILVEIDASKPSGYSPSPLIFTTAKIHTDGKTKHMEPVQVTPVPILSTVEASLTKSGNITTNEKKVANASNGTLINIVCNTNIANRNDAKQNTQQPNTATTIAQINDFDKCITTSQNKTNDTTLNQAQKSSDNIISNFTTKSTKETSANNQQKEMPDVKAVVTTSSSIMDQNKSPTVTTSSILDQKKTTMVTASSSISDQKKEPTVTTSSSILDQKKTTAMTTSSSILDEKNVIASNQTSKSISQPTVSTSYQNQTSHNTKQSEKSLADKQTTGSESVQLVECKPKEEQSQSKITDSSTAPINVTNNDKSQIKIGEGVNTKQSQMPKVSELTDTSKTKKIPDVTTSMKTPADKPPNSTVKIVSSSIKQPNSSLQSKANISNVSKENEKTPKTSANEVKLTISNKTQSVTANTSINKVMDKSPAVSTTGGINIKVKSQPLTAKASNTKTDITTTSNLPKSVSTAKSISSTKTVSSAPLTVISKSTASLTKPVSKVTTVSSQKTSGISIASSTSAIKQPVTSSVKGTSPSVTKSSSTSSSSNPVTTKPSNNKPSQVSSKPESSNTVTPTTTAAVSSNGIAKPDVVKNVTKPNDITTKVSKA